METDWQQFALILGLVLLNAFFAAGEIAVISSRPVRIKQLAEEGNRNARVLLRLMEDHSRFLATIQVGITLAGFLASASAAIGISQPVAAFLTSLGLSATIAQSLAVGLVTLVIAYITLVLGELTPKRLALQSPERIALFVARPVYWVSKAFGPFTALLTWSTNIVVRLMGGSVETKDQTISEEELRFYVKEHQELETEEKQLIAGVFDFGDRLVRHVMVPRTEMECIHQDTVLSEAMRQARATGYWRYPVYREDYDDIVGIISVKDLLYQVEKGTETTVAAMMRPALFIPETKRALMLLKEMQSKDEQLAIVVDEYGGVAGLVTMEDLLEEIVGDVREDDQPARTNRNAEILLDATEAIVDINDRFNVNLPDSPHYETLAGYILHVLGEIPEEGATLEAEGLRLVVEQMEGRRISQVRVVPVTAQENGDERERTASPDGESAP